MPSAPSELHFEIDSWVVFQLGEQLVTDVVQALVELVKNCYDADATYAKVAIYTADSPGEGYHYADAPGYMVIEDNGTGMAMNRIRDGWLFISSSHKREFKANRQMTAKGRTPLGDKGLGRLCTQRLGMNVEIITRPEGPEGQNGGYHVGFSWADFHSGKSLSEIRIHFDKAQRKNVGTSLVVSGLKDVEEWTTTLALERLQNGLSRLISPFQLVRDFFAMVSVNDAPLQLADISEDIRSAATIRYALESDGKTFSVRGRYRLDYIRPPVSQKEEQDQFREFVEADKGAAFADFLLDDSRARDFAFRKAKLPWYLEFEVRKSLEEMPELPRIHGELANPGPFRGEVDSFDLGDDTTRPADIFTKAAEFRQYISQMHGIRVYRDGFGIRVDEDWLGLGKLSTKGRSAYSLKPANTLGFIAITARDNPSLQETTNREGFTDTPYYRTFYALLQEFVKLSSQAQDLIRRGWVEFRKRQAVGREPDTPISAEELTDQLRDRLAAAAEGSDRLKAFGTTLETVLNHCTETIRATTADGAKAPPEVRAALHEVESVVHVFQGVRDEVERRASEVEHLRHLGEQVSVRLEGLRSQLADMYETVGLGLTAEALSHEIAEIANGLAERTQSIRKKLSKDLAANKPLNSYLTHVSSAVAALRKQLAHLAPSLKYVRHQREPIELLPFLREMEDYHTGRLAAKHIGIDIKGNGFTVTMNRGRLTQIFDNLCLNCEYWLEQEMLAKRMEAGTITVEMDRPFFRIWENGRGIDPTVEGSLFEPFVTGKPLGQGRGLGLFITSQLLEGDGCRISVLSKRNRHRRLYIFQIDLSGAINA